MRTLTELNTLILGWAAERKILKNSTPFAQAKKTAEEVMELIQADRWYHVALVEEGKRLAKLDVVTGEPEDSEDVKCALMDIKDAIGDIYVTLVVGLGCGGNAMFSDCAIHAIGNAEWQANDTTPLTYLVCDQLLDFYAYVGRNEDERWLHDTVVEIMGVLSCLAKSYGMTLQECVEAAYDQIKDRKGYLREDGVFVKETV